MRQVAYCPLTIYIMGSYRGQYLLGQSVVGSLLFVINNNDFQVQGHLDALVRMAQSCVIKVRATPKDVRAYFTNSSPVSRSGQCFAACMLEQSDVINHGKVNIKVFSRILFQRHLSHTFL